MNVKFSTLWSIRNHQVWSFDVVGMQEHPGRNPAHEQVFCEKIYKHKAFCVSFDLLRGWFRPDMLPHAQTVYVSIDEDVDKKSRKTKVHASENMPCEYKDLLLVPVTPSKNVKKKRQLAMRILTLSAILGTLDGPQKSTKYRSSQNPAKFSSRKSSTMSQAQNLLLDLRSLGSGRGARIEAGIRYRRVTSARQTEKRNKRRYGMHLYASKIFQVFHHVLHTFCIK